MLLMTRVRVPLTRVVSSCSRIVKFPLAPNNKVAVELCPQISANFVHDFCLSVCISFNSINSC